MTFFQRDSFAKSLENYCRRSFFFLLESFSLHDENENSNV